MHDLVFAQIALRQLRPAARLGPSGEQARADALYALLLATLDRRRLAARVARRALALAARIADPATSARVKLYAAWTHEFCGQVADAEHELFGRPLRANFGVRYVRVDTGMTAYKVDATTKAVTLTHGEKTANKLLPSLTLRYEPVNDVLLRFNYGETLRRPGFGDLNQHGPAAIQFYTKTKTVTSRWPSGIKDGAEFVIPTMS